MKTLLSILAILSLLTGCTTAPTQPNEPTTAQTVTDADRCIVGGYTAISQLSIWEHNHRAQLKAEPGLEKPLKAAKAKLWAGIESSTKRRDAFEKDSTADNRARLDQALIELNLALDNSAKFLAERATRQKVR